MSYQDQAMQYFSLVNQGMSPAEAYATAFPEGVPTEEDYLRDQAKDQQKQALGGIAGAVGGALGVKGVADLVSGTGWFAPAAGAGEVATVGSGIASAPAASSYFIPSGSISLTAPVPAASSGLMGGAGSGGGFGGGAAASSGAAAPGSFSAGIPALAGLAAFAATADPVHKFLDNNLQPAVTGGMSSIGSAFGMGLHDTRPMTDDEILASTANLEHSIPGFSNLSPEQQRSFIEQAKSSGLLNLAVTAKPEGAPLDEFSNMDWWRGPKLGPLSDPGFRTYMSRQSLMDDTPGLGMGKSTADKFSNILGRNMNGKNMLSPLNLNLQDQLAIGSTYGGNVGAASFLGKQMMDQYGLGGGMQPQMAAPQMSKGGGMGQVPQSSAPQYNMDQLLSSIQSSMPQPSAGSAGINPAGMMPQIMGQMGAAMQPQENPKFMSNVGNAMAAALMPQRSNTRSPGIDMNGNRIRY